MMDSPPWLQKEAYAYVQGTSYSMNMNILFCISHDKDVTETDCNDPPFNIGGETTNDINL